ncbi:DUF7144 family membrane protein [Salinactinospora qingdaonensis]|uniref:DUF7144 domain-containing protein n=1 Tax=Salinactinospora qingdaonensis TaxID=702744 RepID=A0ABP7EZ49_9ACTN
MSMNAFKANAGGAFAEAILFIVGIVNVIQGIVAMATPGYFFVAGTDMLLFGFVPWGVIMTVLGVLLVLAGFALLTGQRWARTTAVVLAGLNVIGQLMFLVASPFWSAIIIAISVLAIYALTSGWGAGAAETYREATAYRSGRADAASRVGTETSGERGVPTARSGEQPKR